jgi:hypothetical protein
MKMLHINGFFREEPHTGKLFQPKFIVGSIKNGTKRIIGNKVEAVRSATHKVSYTARRTRVLVGIATMMHVRTVVMSTLNARHKAIVVHTAISCSRQNTPA